MTMRFIIGPVLAVATLGNPILEIQAAETTTQPGSPSNLSAKTKPAPLDPGVEKILDRLERKEVKDIEADLKYVTKDMILDTTQKYEGILRFIMDKPNPRFFIRFDKFSQAGIVSNKKQWHLFDGQWYIEAREKTSTISRIQIVRPGEKLDVFKIGKGPFPLPFGQKKDDIVRHFDVKLIAPDPKKDPPDTDHLECKPKIGTELADKYGTVHFYIHRKLDLPILVRTVEKEDGKEIEARFSPDKMKINKGLPGSKLNLPPLPGYEVSEDRLPPPIKRQTDQ